MTSTMGQYQSALSSQYLNKAFIFKISYLEYHTIFMYNVSASKEISKGRSWND